MSDVENVQPLPLFSPPRRTASAPASMDTRPTHSRLSTLQRAAAIVLSLDAQPTAAIARKAATSPASIRRWTRRIDEEELLRSGSRSGRPRILTNEQRTAILQEAKERKKTTPKEIKRKLELDNISARTIRRRLNEEGLFGRVARQTPPLTVEHVRKRLSFCNGYGGWSLQQWDTVLWSDETSIQLGPNGQTWVQRPIGAAWDPAYVVHKRKHPPKVHMWGCMSSAGVGECHLFVENLEKSLMKHILNEHLLKSAHTFWPKGQWFFQQDNDPKHSSKLVQGWINLKGIDCLEWPPYSPDLNPIEHLWADLKKRVEKENPRSIEELITVLQLCWDATDKAFCAKLVHSMPKRMAACIAHAGWMSGY